MIQTAPSPHVVWSPLPGSQALALACPCHNILYHGTRGPGKTDWQLMDFRKLVGVGYNKFWRGVIFDREYKNLDDLVAKSKKWFPQFNDGAKFKEAAKDYKWVWPTGEELLFRVGYRPVDYDKFHGHEYPFIGFNELTKQPNRKFYDLIRSCNRSSFLPLEHSPDLNNPLPEIPLITASTTNPHGVGHNWVKAEFIDQAPPGVVVRTSTKVFNPRSKQHEIITRTKVHLFGSYRENRYLSPEYVAELDGITDQNLRKAWLLGDWNIVAGGAIDDLWKEKIHVKPRFKIPEGWHIDRSFDWGSSQPFSVGWWAQADGTEATLPDGSKFCPVRGSLIRLWEWYGTKETGSNEGLKLSAPAVAKGIQEMDASLLSGKWILKKPNPGPADNAIRNVTEVDTDTIEKKMADNGIEWTESDKSPGSRKIGLQLFRDHLEASIKQEGPGVYFMDCCKASLSTLPVLPRDPKDPDDVDTDSEDHVYDDVRYRVLKGNNRYATSIKVKFLN